MSKSVPDSALSPRSYLARHLVVPVNGLRRGPLANESFGTDLGERRPSNIAGLPWSPLLTVLRDLSVKGE